MKLIPLTKGLFAKVDDEDYDDLSKYNWQAKKQNYTYYASRSQLKHEYIGGKRKTTIYMQRQILKLTDPNLDADHDDHDGLNNQKYNLRTSTKSQNSTNRKSMEGASSKYLGVSLSQGTHKRKLKDGSIKEYPYRWWMTRITINKKSTFIGSFKTEKEAALAYNEAAKKHNIEFANINIIE